MASINPCKLFILFSVATALLLPSFPAQDAYVRDNPADTGIEPNPHTGAMWQSPDIWVRRNPDPNWVPYPHPTASPTWTPQAHQNPEYRERDYAQPNYVYVRVTNRDSTATDGTERLRVYWAKAGTGLSWPDHWTGAPGNADADTYYANDCGTYRVFGKEITKPRKKASTATADEKQIYADAVVALDSAVHPGSTETYFNLQDMIHSMGHAQHFNDAFVAWHREFVNRYEQALLKQDPRVTLLYWDWHENPNIAGYNFMGSFGGTASVAGTTVNTSFIYDTGSARGAPVQPFANFAPSTSVLGGAPTIRTIAPPGGFGDPWELWRGPFNAGLQSLLKTDATVLQATDYGNFAYDPPAFAIPGDPMLQTPIGDIQSNPHNPAHVTHGNLYNGTTTSVAYPQVTGAANLGGNFAAAAEDPFFFMLHGNVDRLWAQWQRDQSLSGYSLDRLSQAQAYNGANTTAGSEMGGTIGPWDGVGAGIAPWTSAGGYINVKPYNHASVYSPPIYDAAPLYVPALQPGESVIIQIPWYPPNPDDFDCFGAAANQKGHFCLLARIETEVPSPYGMTTLEGSGLGANVRNNNNIAWKNLTVVDDFSGLGLAGIVGGIVIRNISPVKATLATLHFHVTGPDGQDYPFNDVGTMTVDIPVEIFQAWQRGGGKVENVEIIDDGGTVRILSPRAKMFDFPLAPGEFFGITPQFQLGQNRHKATQRRFRLDVQQIQDNQVVGGNTYDIDFNKMRLVKPGSRWAYQDLGVAAEQGWNTSDFDDGSWKVGNANFGYKVDDNQTKYTTRLNTYNDLRNCRVGKENWQGCPDYEPIVTSYFRHQFQSSGGDAYRSLTLRAQADDGLIVYINGVEVSRYCLRGAVVQYDTYAEASVEGAQENFYRTYDLSQFLQLLKPGNNVIAAELHQAEGSYDAAFDLQLFADGPEQLDIKPAVAINFRNRLEHGPGLHDSIHCIVGGTMCSVRSNEAIPLLVDAVDDGVVVETRVYINGKFIQEVKGNRIETQFFSRGLHNNGAILVRAEAVDDAGNVGSVERIIRVVDNLPPLVEIESVGRRSIVREGESVKIHVDARDIDGEVAKVRFYYKSCTSPLGVPAALFAEVNEPPYVATANNIHAGAQIFTVQVEDNDGAIVEESVTVLGARYPELVIEATSPNGAISISWDESVLQSAKLQSSTDFVNWTDVNNSRVPFQVSTGEGSANYYRLAYDLTEATSLIGLDTGPINSEVGPIFVNPDGGGVVVDPGGGGVVVDPDGGQIGGNNPIVGAAVAADKWQLSDRDGNEQSLEDFRGEPLVMLFFLGHDCLVCLEQLEAMKAAHSAFETAGVNVVALSPDTVEDLAGMQDFPFALLSDADRSVFGSYGVKDGDGEPTHAVVIIDGGGQLVLRELSDLPDMNLGRILAIARGQ